MAPHPSPVSTRTAVFTIVSNNYLHFPRVLMRSLRAVSPEWDRYVLLADESHKKLDVPSDLYATVEVDTLPIPEIRKMLFRYAVLELNTAVKPWFFRHLFAQGYERVVYLDPDIFVYAPMQEVEALLADGALAVLVPHLTGRLLDQQRPGEYDILQSGAYNLGFLALGRHGHLDDLLEFWCEKSQRDFVSDLSRGLFTDQRWMDLVPGMFPDVRILRHEGYDVAYWNLPHRNVRRRGSGYVVNGVPLTFFHFSGIDPTAPEGFSKHQDRYRLATVGEVADLAQAYCRALSTEDLDIYRNMPYAYGALADGTPIPDVLRKLYRSRPEVEDWAGHDPFARTHTDWSAPLDDGWPRLTRVMLAVYQSRSDLRLTWPDVTGADREAFARWFSESPEVSAEISQAFIDPIRTSMAEKRAERPSRVRQLPASRITGELAAGALRKAWIAWREGRLPLSPQRWLQLLRLHKVEHAQAQAARGGSPLPPFIWPAVSPRRSSAPFSRLHAPAEDAHPPTESSAPAGLTIVGYLQDGTGVAAGAHASAIACNAAGVPCELVDARPLKPVRGNYPVSLLHVNADQTTTVAGLLGENFFEDRYTIGTWAWELEELPPAFEGAFAWVNEVWAPSSFIQRAIADKAPVPVTWMPYAVTAAPTPGLSRREFGLPEDTFLFLMMYDVLSIQERKNPLGAIEAFRRAFPRPAGVGLVVRVNHALSRPDDVAIVRQAVAETEGAVLLEQPLSRGDAQALQASCDALVALHRSEGFGLNIAESMLLGKPVIATGWSGNMDFTTPQNACLVDYDLTTLSRDLGPYRKGSRWAEPDVSQAADWMRRLVEDDTYRQRIAARGQAQIAADYSPQAVGQRYLRRLALIRRS